MSIYAYAKSMLFILMNEVLSSMSWFVVPSRRSKRNNSHFTLTICIALKYTAEAVDFKNPGESIHHKSRL